MVAEMPAGNHLQVARVSTQNGGVTTPKDTLDARDLNDMIQHLGGHISP